MPTKFWEWVVFVAACCYLILTLLDLLNVGRA